MIFHVVISTLLQGCFIVTTQSVSWTYTVVEADLGWEESRIMCQKNVTELAIIKSYKTDSKLKQIMEDYETITECLWIGMSYSPTEDVFKWLDGGVAENIPWAKSEPNCETGRDRNCLSGEEHCVAIDPTRSIKSSFLTLSCQQNCMGLCQKQDDIDSVTITEPFVTTPSTVFPVTSTETIPTTETPTTPSTVVPVTSTETIPTTKTSTTPSTVVPVTSTETIPTTETPTTLFESSNTHLFYHLFMEDVSSNEAADLCNSFDMKIATIESELIYNLVKDYLDGVDMGSGCMWIGLYWELQILRHVWDDGEPLTWAQWYTGDPSCTKPTDDTHCNGIERNCVSFTQDFNFRTKDCNGMCNMLCESNRSRIEITTSNNNLTLSSAIPTEITTSNNNLTLSSATPTEITTSNNNLTLSSATPTEITTSNNNLTLSSATPTEELSLTTEITNVITASPALNTLWKIGAWSFHYIHLDNKDVNLTHARQLCKEKNMDIVMIKDEGRWEIIKDIIQYLQLNGINNTGYWIGMVWHENLQQHKWLDNYTVTWTKWSDEEPKCMRGRITLWSAVSVCQGKIQNCVVSNGSFVRTSNCANLHKVICQQYIPLVAASTDVVETRPKLLNCKCSMQKINQKWHFLDGANISDTRVENLVQKDFEDNVKGNISVIKSSLSSVIQKRNSIDDKRSESKAIGWSATLFVAIPVTFIIIVDVIDMMRYLRSP